MDVFGLLKWGGEGKVDGYSGGSTRMSVFRASAEERHWECDPMYPRVTSGLWVLRKQGNFPMFIIV